jgi:hypothetical protein
MGYATADNGWRLKWFRKIVGVNIQIDKTERNDTTDENVNSSVVI